MPKSHMLSSLSLVCVCVWTTKNTSDHRCFISCTFYASNMVKHWKKFSYFLYVYGLFSSPVKLGAFIFGTVLQWSPDNSHKEYSRGRIMWPLDNWHILLNHIIIICTIVCFTIDSVDFSVQWCPDNSHKNTNCANSDCAKEGLGWQVIVEV